MKKTARSTRGRSCINNDSVLTSLNVNARRTGFSAAREPLAVVSCTLFSFRSLFFRLAISRALAAFTPGIVSRILQVPGEYPLNGLERGGRGEGLGESGNRHSRRTKQGECVRYVSRCSVTA